MNGVVVNEFLQSSDPDIYALGDCTAFHHPRYERSIRLESVQNANDQADIAARHLCGQAAPYEALPWFWSDQFDMKIQIVGMAFEVDDTVTRSDTGNRRNLSVFYLKDRELVSACAINRPKDFIAAKRLIANRDIVSSRLLADPSRPLDEALQR